MTTTPPTVAVPSAPARRSVLRSVGLPTEHGGWSLTAEPVVLALVVAWSWSGLLLGLAAVLAFVARTPVKIVLVDRWRGRHLDRTATALRVASAELAVLAVLVVGAALLAEQPFWAPLAVALPLVLVELWFDMRSRSRRLLPELAGTVGIGSVAAAIVLADGGDGRLAVALWCVVAARSVAAISSVRHQVAHRHGQPPATTRSDAAQLVAVVLVILGWAFTAVPFASVVAVGVVAMLGLRAVRVPPPRPAVIGLQQMAIGLLVVAVTAAAVLAT